MDRPLRIGIVGCGSIARAHAKAYRAAGATVVCVYDVAPAAAGALAAETGARVAASLDEMARRDRLDAVSLCSPPAAHLENARPFLAARVPILCEKPLEVNARRAARLVEAARRTRVPFMVGFCHRFHPAIIELKRLIHSGALGRPVLFRNLFGGRLPLRGNHRADPARSGGGCLIDHCCHSIDLFRHLVGEPTEVQAMAANVVQNVPIEDFGMIHLARRGRAFGEIAATYSLPVCANRVEWYGTKGAAVVNYWTPGEPDLRWRAGGEEWRPVDCSAHPDRFEGQIRHFLECVRSGRRPSVTAEDGLRANRIVDAAYASVRRGRTVRLAEDLRPLPQGRTGRRGAA